MHDLHQLVQGTFFKKIDFVQNEVAWITLHVNSARATQVTSGATHAVHERTNDLCVGQSISPAKLIG